MTAIHRNNHVSGLEKMFEINWQSASNRDSVDVVNVQECLEMYIPSLPIARCLCLRLSMVVIMCTDMHSFYRRTIEILCSAAMYDFVFIGYMRQGFHKEVLVWGRFDADP